MTTLELFADADAFLDRAADHVALDPVLNTVLAACAEREAAEGRATDPTLPHWYALARGPAGAVVGTAMRTAPFAPYPPYLLPMPDDAAVALARLLHERGEAVGGANGAVPAVRIFADETARLSGGAVAVRMHSRLFELHRVRTPRRPAGGLRVATESDLDLALGWYAAFHADADEQAGRSSGHDGEAVTPEIVLRRIRSGRLFLWDVDGVPVHMTGRNPSAYGAARLGPVFTPREHRGLGYAKATVAELSQQILDEGDRPCLFTDQANPVSNRVYEAIGYERVVDMVNLMVCPPDGDK